MASAPTTLPRYPAPLLRSRPTTAAAGSARAAPLSDRGLGSLAAERHALAYLVDLSLAGDAAVERHARRILRARVRRQRGRRGFAGGLRVRRGDVPPLTSRGRWAVFRLTPISGRA